MIDIINDNFNDLAKDYYELQEEYEQLQQENKQLKEDKKRAIEYIQKRFEINEYGEYYFTHTFDKCNMRELLEILEGNNENI